MINFLFIKKAKVNKMKNNRTEIRSKLYDLGHNIGLNHSEVDNAKKTAKTIIGICVIAGIFALIGIFTSRLDAVGLWYSGVSIKDFGMLNNFL